MKTLTSEELAGHIIDLFNHPDKLAAMAAAARQKVKAELNWSAVANKMFAVIDRHGK